MLPIEFIQAGRETKRFHTCATLTEQKIDAHSYGVAMLCAVMCGGAPSRNLLMAALTHDLAEWKLGDLPAPTKRHMPNVEGGMTFRTAWGLHEARLLHEHNLDWEAELNGHDSRILKLADAMEGALFCIRERMLGNKLIRTVYANFRSYIDDVGWSVEEKAIADLVAYIDDMWEQADG